MKTLMLSSLLITLFLTVSLAQKADTSFLYNPGVNAQDQINKAISQAQAENKHVLIQVGGNWCPWCIKLHQYMAASERIDSIISKDYVLIYVNYSKENKNLETMARLDYPQRFGFPVLVILDDRGNRLHTQNTVYLEENEYYSEEVIVDFLKSWNRKALDPATYSKK